MITRTKGVYFLASDSVYDLVVAFLESFRTHNTVLPLCLLPFDENYSKIAQLAHLYEFIIFSDFDVLESCDLISQAIHGCTLGHYRKLALWFATFDDFIYIDVDTIVLRNFTELYSLLQNYDVITASSRGPDTTRYVWKNPPRGILSDWQIDYAANTGLILSSSGAISWENITAALTANAFLVQHMELACMEQAFLNSLIVTSTERYSSLREIDMASPNLKLPLEVWGADVEPYDTVESLEQRLGHPALFIHWAGLRGSGLHLRTSLWRLQRYKRRI